MRLFRNHVAVGASVAALSVLAIAAHTPAEPNAVSTTATVTFTAGEVTGNVKDPWYAPPSGTAETTGTYRVDPDPAETVDGVCGIFFQRVWIGQLLGGECQGGHPSHDSPPTQCSLIEWIELRGDGGGVFPLRDTFSMGPEGNGCWRAMKAYAGFYPAGAPGYGEFKDYLMDRYDQAKPVDDEAIDGNVLDTPDGFPRIQTGAFRGGVYDTSGDGLEDIDPADGRSLDGVADPNDFAPSSSAQFITLQWNFCPIAEEVSINGGSGKVGPQGPISGTPWD